MVESESEWRSVRKSEGESKPDANFNVLSIACSDTKLIHTASLTSNILPRPTPSSTLDNLPNPLPIEFHTAIDICFEIYLQIIYITHDVVITPSCFTTCASTSASRSNQEVVKK